MTSDQLLIIAGAVLAILFAYVPGLGDWFKKLDETVQRLVMLVILAVTTGVIFGLSCASILTKVTCDKAGAIGIVTAFFYALISNQGTYAILPKVGVNTRIAKNVTVTTAEGITSNVEVKELGTAAITTPEPPK